MNVNCDSNASCIIDGDYIKGIFEFNSTFRNIEITGNIKKIPTFCFCGCSELESVSLCSKITYIGNFAFSYCRKLKNITIPKTVTSIGIQCFSYCSSLEKVELPNKVNVIQNSLFFFCSNLIYIKLPKYLEQISKHAFVQTRCQFPEQQSGFQAYQYSGQMNIEATAPKDSSFLPPFCFFNSKLTSIKIDGRVKIIGTHCFACTDIEEVNLSKVEILGGSAFAQSWQLKRVIFSDSLKTICECAFYNCSQLTTLELGSQNNIGICESAFDSCTKLDITFILSKIKHIPANCFYCVQKAEAIVIHSNIDYIEDYAFFGASCINSLEIEEGIKRIGRFSFSGLEITSLILPDSLNYIGEYCFSSCDKLINVKVGKRVTYIPEGLFDECISLQNLEINGEVTYFGDKSFKGRQILITKIAPRSYFGEKILSGVRSNESVEFGNDCLVCEQHLMYHFQTIKFGDGTCFLEEIKADNYYYTGSEKDDHNVDGSIYKMITKYAASVYVPNSYMATSFCGKPINYYSTAGNQKQKLHELKQKTSIVDQSKKLNPKRLKNANIQYIKECNIFDNKTIGMERIERMNLIPMKCIISLIPSIV
ncbi:surface antigen BspA-like [Trichomonas vaginalis G3]|uniref:Surface antigen BspA-like n=1 Tax=Trichomonas vaginalis (strain ATCC PRA-98 / G3) TaxID=412133 RepID=A2ELC3_TRIV3|nr:leucine-rich repeats (6 copies)-containing protein [Trichomonas vaginalis G3]EAY06525.1 surface antigen BspA-like [Trichomonas vaginalis G3]KAI5526094.1 leucine-rich repeats (6 copies)-containing protein [Trichomonas vaginalis G3]|eukprot:XP_001318748.1 surface antigen BspA-like [Trichomonas vaginalis G3]